MKYCDACHNSYPDDFTACPVDKGGLRNVAVPPPGTVIHGRREILEAVAVTRPWTPRPPTPPPQTVYQGRLPNPKSIQMRQMAKRAGIALAVVLAVNVAYRIYLSRSRPPAAIVVTDEDLKKEVQSKLLSSAIFEKEKVSVLVQNGVVMLAGTVGEDWKRMTAANIASSVPGVSDVKNGIQVRETVQAPKPVWKTGDEAPEVTAAKRPPRVITDPSEKARELVAQGNYYVSHRDYDSAVRAFQSALELDASNYEARSGLQEAQRLR
jgi:hypothetical protein